MGKAVYPDPHPIARYRVGSGLSLRHLARKARLDFRRLSIIERGLSATEVARLAAALGCSPADLQHKEQEAAHGA